MGNNNQSRQRQALPDDPQKHVNSVSFWLMGIIVFLIGFVLASQLIIYLIPGASDHLDIPLAEQKFNILKNSDHQYNVVFLGTSRMYRGIDPDIVDAEAKKLGCQIKSYNLGIPGLSSLEQQYLVEQLNTFKNSINTIVIEPYSVPDRTLNQFTSKQRRFFYDWEHIEDVVRDHFSMPNVLGLKVISRDSFFLVYAFIYEQMGVGRLSQLFFPIPEQANETYDFKPSSGFQSIDAVHNDEMTRRRNNFLTRIESFKNKLKQPGITANQGTMNSRYDITMQTVNDINDIKKKPVVLMMPQIAFAQHAKTLEQQLLVSSDKTISVMNLNKPKHYTDLFNIDNWFDESHLNKQGSVILSTLVARHLCAVQEQEK